MAVEVTRCWCCGLPELADGTCSLCDAEGVMTSPVHVCERSDRLIGDEHIRAGQPCPDEERAWPTIH